MGNFLLHHRIVHPHTSLSELRRRQDPDSAPSLTEQWLQRASRRVRVNNDRRPALSNRPDKSDQLLGPALSESLSLNQLHMQTLIREKRDRHRHPRPIRVHINTNSSNRPILRRRLNRPRLPRPSRKRHTSRRSFVPNPQCFTTERIFTK